jgi:hypothetical protein
VSDRHQLLIMYRHDVAAADELRWCLRSLANVSGCNPVPLVVGDPPDWYTGPQFRLPPQGPYWVDQRAKFAAVATSHLVADRFALFADDNAVVRPIEFENLMIPRERRGLEHDPGPDAREWLRIRWKTAVLLRAQSLEYRDLECHWPRCWERAKLAKLLGMYSDPKLVFKTLYHGHYRGPTEDCRLDMQEAFRAGVGVCEDARIIAHTNRSFLAGIRTALQSLFPDPSPWESGEVPDIPAIGHVSPQMQHACRHLGDSQAVNGSLPVYQCSLHGLCGPFGGAATDCRSCGDYRPNPGRVVRIGKATRLSMVGRNSGQPVARRCGKPASVRASAMMQPKVIQAVLDLVPPGGTILEFGSGRSTEAFAAAGRTVVAIEHDSRWIQPRAGVEFVQAPIVGRWYDLQIVRDRLAGLRPDAVVIDGPKGYGRTDRLGFRDVADLIPPETPIVVDDANRPKEAELVEWLLADSARSAAMIGRASVLQTGNVTK